ncbi:hypothetical protein PEPS_42670 (plasmid) [Persicobacter psychrovividus]|uniref:Uncharacterized protein n=1 Tax=Persicobacter psychrovividus TaxID=387638 RepID=A0ABN6LFW6_9BACT|nr:hypothetical protein PEPS_42670 [Persicobacter psychrovividus]
MSEPHKIHHESQKHVYPDLQRLKMYFLQQIIKTILNPMPKEEQSDDDFSSAI